ncbi:hypothetical protein [Geodermatophilus sp. SYSU D01036]
MVGATPVVVAGAGLPGAVRGLLLVLATLTALAGWLLTFRDLTPPRRR